MSSSPQDRERTSQACLTFSWQAEIPSRNAGGTVVTPGIVFGASMTTSTGARHQLSVTVHFPGLSVASEASKSSFSSISNAGKKLLASTWRLDFNSCAVEEILEGAGFQSAFQKMSPSMGVSLPFQGDNPCSEIQSCEKEFSLNFDTDGLFQQM